MLPTVPTRPAVPARRQSGDALGVDALTVVAAAAEEHSG